MYLTRFTFPDAERESGFRMGVRRTCYDSFYPFGVLSRRGLTALKFEPITVLYGGNGSGKTTALNVIAEKLALQRDARFNRTSFFEAYTDMCRAETAGVIPAVSRVITSDDVFDFMLNLRAINDGIDEKREELFEEYLDAKYSDFRLRSLDDYEQLKKVNASRGQSQSRYVRNRLMNNTPEQSNGESAYFYFTEKIQDNGLYLLDEPENSLSVSRQQALARFIEESARFYGGQFVIATHSPFVLAMRGARVYDLDADPACVKRWTELSAVREYYDFFMLHKDAFSDDDA